ncbi:hypothetical protein KPH14_005103 [Odynerus spinipes]|uniref:Evolutionarily conserved signaling intermediate in Toll pathway, mitochondrial n=1 Tax=Odynerus spinipes TaxID=1348599 RepID=A0AAD9RKS7_9HYME|nr:hypothetical protein KPH14_005103 [Odynerus spinipes]
MMSLMRSSCLMFRFAIKTEKRFYEFSYVISPLEGNRLLHTGQYLFNQSKKQDKEKNTLMTYVFENTDKKQKDTFLEILRIYEKEKHRRGHLTFIKIALKYMEAFNVHKDLEVYKALLNILPKGPYIPRSYYQTVLRYYPKHQDVATEVLEQMEDNHVIPDRELEDILLNTFGKHAIPLKKLWRMLYWMPKFANLNPWPVSKPVPKDPKILAKIAIHKISSIDVTSNISEFETTDVEEDEECVEDTWIISAISPIQKDLLVEYSRVKKGESVYVEGPFKVWVADQSVDYFVLRGNIIDRPKRNEDIDDVSNLEIPFWKNEVAIEPTVHEQEDGIYFAVCATGTSSKDSAASWIRCLQIDNPILKEIPILIKLASSVETELVALQDSKKRLEAREAAE